MLLWVVVDHWVFLWIVVDCFDRFGSLWIVVNHCGSFFVLVRTAE